MLENICKFIQSEDRNSDIMDCYKEVLSGEMPEETLMIICYQNLNYYLVDGLEFTPRVKGYMDFLENYVTFCESCFNDVLVQDTVHMLWGEKMCPTCYREWLAEQEREQELRLVHDEILDLLCF
jgi:hypothetical protein